MTLKAIKLNEFVGKDLSEVKDYLEKTYPGQLATAEDRKEFMETFQDVERGSAYYFFGSVVTGNRISLAFRNEKNWGENDLPMGFGKDYPALNWGSQDRVVLIKS